MKLSLLPLAHMVGRRVFGREPPALHSVAARSWQVAPAVQAVVPPAYALPGQLQRVTAWAFASEHPAREMAGGYVVTHAATRAFVVERAWLVDGVLYKAMGCAHLRPRAHRIPRLHATDRFERGAVYCTPGGNRYFGSWLLDDCPQYALACAHGQPVTTDPPMSPHALAYETLLGMAPARTSGAFFDELVVFDDVGHNHDKRGRFAALRANIRAQVRAQTGDGTSLAAHPGVFLIRGHAGQRRILRNERAIAEHLRDQRGFRIVDPMQGDVGTILAACLGARVIAGVEGSGLIHGVMALAPGAAILTLQPPDRFVSVYKHVADRDGHRFAYVVGLPHGDGDFRIDVQEVERTLDLLPAADPGAAC